MHVWQILIPNKATMVIIKLRILLLLEFIPKEEIKDYIYDFLGLADECEKAEGLTCVREEPDEFKEEIGLSRTGSDDLLENMGMMSIVIIAIMVVTSILTLIRLLAC